MYIKSSRTSLATKYNHKNLMLIFGEDTVILTLMVMPGRPHWGHKLSFILMFMFMIASLERSRLYVWPIVMISSSVFSHVRLIFRFPLRWLKTVSSTFQDVDLDGSL